MKDYEKINEKVARKRLHTFYARLAWGEKGGCTPENDVYVAYVQRCIDASKAILKEGELSVREKRIERENAIIEAEIDCGGGELVPF